MKLRKKVIFSAIVFIVFFLCAELISRVFILPACHDYIERHIIEQRLSKSKGPNEFRIFLFGESTMHGHYLYPYSTIDIWLKLYLRDLLARSDSNRITLANFGRYGADSTFITTAFIDTIKYLPDVAIFYSAHNDFCVFGGRREFFAKKSFSDMIEETGTELLKHSAFLNVINRLVIKSKIESSRLRGIEHNKHDTWYPEDDKGPNILEDDLLFKDGPKFNMLMSNFMNNIKRAVSAAKRHSITAIFLESVAKWKGYEPVKSIHGAMINSKAIEIWEERFSLAGESFKSEDYLRAIELYRMCLKLDPDYALTYYRIGECYEALGEGRKANQYYSLANDYDRYPIRAPSSVNLFYETLRSEENNGIFLVKTQEVFEDNAPGNIIDDELIGDQIHPAIRGQALIALEVAKVLYQNDLIVPKDKWRWDRLRPVEEMKNDLNLDGEGELETILAVSGYIKKDYVKTSAFLEKAIAMKPESIFIKSWLAWAYWKSGRQDESLKIYKELYHDNPEMTTKFFKRHPEIEKAFDVDKHP